MNEPNTIQHPLNPELAADLVAALSEVADVPKGEKASAGKKQYRYFDLASLHQMARPILAAHGLAWIQEVDSTPCGPIMVMGWEGGKQVPQQVDGMTVTVTTVFLHRSGATYRAGRFSLQATAEPQQVGIATTYARRYSLSAALGVAGDADDDAGSAHQRAARQVPARNVGPTLGEQLFERLRALPDPIKPLVKTYAEEKGRGLRAADLEDDSWRGQLVTFIDVALADLAAAEAPVEA